MKPEVKDEVAGYVVVGSGAGGATVARTLSEAGMDVVIIEEGPEFPLNERTTSMANTMRKSMREAGMTTMLGRPMIPYLQGCCVGGTTVMNGAIVWRLPEDLHSEWILADPGLTDVHSIEAFTQSFDTIESDLGTRPVGDDLSGKANDLIRMGCESLGWAGRPITRYVSDCRGTARCLQGCPTGSKQSMDATYIPRAIEDGARLYSDTRVESIQIERGKAVATMARCKSDDPGAPDTYLHVRARKGVVLAAGALHSPALLQRCKIGGSLVGKGLMCNPGVSIAGRFSEPIDPWTGATQGYEVTEYRRQGVKLETLLAPPELGTMRLPGAGQGLRKHVDALDRCVLIGAAIRSGAKGQSKPLGRRSVSVKFSLHDSDLEKVRLGITAIAEIMRAAGAEAILPGVHGWPEELDAEKAPQWVARHTPGHKDLKMAVTHLLGGACMGSDPNRSVVSPALAVHGYTGLYVADASVLPTNTGVNPQHTIMAVAMNAARSWLER